MGLLLRWEQESDGLLSFPTVPESRGVKMVATMLLRLVIGLLHFNFMGNKITLLSELRPRTMWRFSVLILFRHLGLFVRIQTPSGHYVKCVKPKTFLHFWSWEIWRRIYLCMGCCKCEISTLPSVYLQWPAWIRGCVSSIPGRRTTLCIRDC